MNLLPVRIATRVRARSARSSGRHLVFSGGASGFAIRLIFLKPGPQVIAHRAGATVGDIGHDQG